MDGSDKENQEEGQISGALIKEEYIKGSPYNPEQDQYGKTKDRHMLKINRASYTQKWQPEQFKVKASKPNVTGEPVHANLGVGITPKRKMA